MSKHRKPITVRARVSRLRVFAVEACRFVATLSPLSALFLGGAL